MIDVIKVARNYLQQGWCQRTLAVDSTGHPVFVADPGAVKWCILGAVYRATSLLSEPSTMSTRIQWEIERETCCFVGTWNDRPGRTQQEVLELMDNVIRRLEES